MSEIQGTGHVEVLLEVSQCPFEVKEPIALHHVLVAVLDSTCALEAQALASEDVVFGNRFLLDESLSSMALWLLTQIPTWWLSLR